MKKLLVLDSHSLIHRAYHALPPLETKKGERVNAVYGFYSVLIKAVQDFNPDYFAAVFDYPALTFRHKQFKEYKAKRPPTPEDLLSQIPKIKESLISLDFPVFEKKGFEADDVIGNICHKVFLNDNVETIVVSGDKDVFQLVNQKTKIYLLKKGIKETVLCDIEKVKEIYNGLEPSQLVDYKSLRGDPSDNIPGVPGIGEKTALTLIKQFKSLDNLYQEVEKKKPEKIKKELAEKLSKFKKEAFLSKELSLIRNDFPLDFTLDKCVWNGFNQEKTKQLFESFNFESLIKRINKNDNGRTNLSLF
jgi:DNA polymerase I